MGFLEEVVIPRFNFWIYVILMMIGLYAMITKNNLIKKLIGMSIFQTAIILFFVSVGVKEGATIPIIDHSGHHEEAAGIPILNHHVVEAIQGHPPSPEGYGAAGAEAGAGAGGHGAGHVDSVGAAVINPDMYANPLPHVLMLTAIVVGVATLGVALAITQKIYKQYGTIEEDEILTQIKRGPDG